MVFAAILPYFSISLVLWSAFWLCVLCIVSAFFLFFVSTKRHIYDSNGKQLPGPRAAIVGRNLGVFNHTLQFRMTQDFEILHKKYGDIVALQLATHNIIVISDPESVKSVLSAPDNVYHKGLKYESMECVLGQGLVTSNGDVWRAHRKLVSPAFHAEKLRQMVPAFVKHAKKLVSKWNEDNLVDGKTTVDWHVAMTQLTGDVICDVGFGYELKSISADDRALPEAINIVLSEILRRVRDLTKIVRILPTHRQRIFRAARDKVFNLVTGIIAARRRGEGGENRVDLLSLLMQASDDETKAKLNDTELLDETMTFLGAGHETTSNMLTWTIYEVAKDKRILAKLLEEIDRVDDPTNVDALTKMHYTEAVLNESMRLHPPVPTISRISTQPTQVSGYDLPTGTTIMLNFYQLHRNEAVWGADALTFRPERWISPSEGALPAAPPHPFAFVPFSAGPRKCIGRLFAMWEAKAVLVTLLSAVTPVLLSEEEPIRVETVTCRPRDGLPVALVKRTK